MNTTKKKCTLKIKNKLLVSNGEEGVKGKKKTGTEIPAIMYKINSYKNTFYYIGNIVNILYDNSKDIIFKLYCESLCHVCNGCETWSIKKAEH